MLSIKHLQLSLILGASVASAAKYANARYGETLRFVSAGKSFAWKFNGLDNRGVDLQHIAPAGFTAKPLTVYVESCKAAESTCLP